ncbi:NAD(P)/FAD-dependent oxidoreductase [Phytoactinopolyspora halotolerans]|uniref:FAD-dependent oxidoreductase n=1 Tax=Phytoactinopolyspora halotolerans TaxID=1981512 RepID=A0A6L9SAE7_9ACTN|nr:FAD-dependent oxidoreductase [Phytoactinopolyspora halotolerans]NEE00950.1 FAD-dependent oxidoreductase [Phytoactinopolyspora halotolerans]
MNTTTRSTRHRVVVLGAGYAGMSAATGLAKRLHPDTARVHLVNARDHFVQRPRLHQVATGQHIRERSLAEPFGRAPVNLTVGWIHEIDLDNRRVDIATTGGTTSLQYDTLVYALGTSIDTTTVPGIEEYAHTLDPADAARIAGKLADLDRGTVIVCGGGLTGIEAATEFAERYPQLTVRLVSRGRPGGWLSDRARAHVEAAFDRLGVEVLADREITAVEDGVVRLGDGSGIPFDLCLWAGGFRVSPLAADAGLAVDERGRALVDQTLRSVSHPEVYVIGDAAAARGPWGDAIAYGCRTGGFLGLYAPGAVMAALTGRDPKAFGFRYIHQCISLGRRDAVIQFVHQNDESPRRRILTGRAAVWYKDIVLNSGTWVFRRPGPILPWRKTKVPTTPGRPVTHV